MKHKIFATALPLFAGLMTLAQTKKHDVPPPPPPVAIEHVAPPHVPPPPPVKATISSQMKTTPPPPPPVVQKEIQPVAPVPDSSLNNKQN